MIDWCHRHQLNILQTLPINETSDDNSPYNAISSLAIEPATHRDLARSTSRICRPPEVHEPLPNPNCSPNCASAR